MCIIKVINRVTVGVCVRMRVRVSVGIKVRGGVRAASTLRSKVIIKC